jgi:hypothetical protein
VARSKENELKYQHCKEAFLDGTTDVKILSIIFSVPERTIHSWRKTGKWDDEINEILNLEKEIEKMSREALRVGLKAYIDDHNNTSLQSLVVLLKDFQNKRKPVKELHDYIIKFLDQTVTYFHSKNLIDFCSEFQSHISGLSEHLRVTNNG